ncbi:MAG: ABC transporter ATP-binding protein [Actinomycetota bacterium]
MNDPLLEVNALSAAYGKLKVLHIASLTVQPGEFVAVVGANGAGKSTLLRAIMGLIRADGSIRFEGRDLLHEPAYKRASLGIAYVPEGRRIFPSLTVEENLRVALHGRGRGGNFDRVYDLFPKLYERRRQQGKTLSGGEQQMLALGRALVVEPTLLIADEVSLGLAPILVERIFQVLSEMHQQGKAVLLAEQNAAISLEAADRAYVLETGQVSLHGPASQLREDERVVRAYLQEV